MALRAGRLKQWLHYLRRCYPEAEAAYRQLRTVNDPAAVSQYLFQPLPSGNQRWSAGGHVDAASVRPFADAGHGICPTDCSVLT
mgnify:FL=1